MITLAKLESLETEFKDLSAEFREMRSLRLRGFDISCNIQRLSSNHLNMRGSDRVIKIYANHALAKLLSSVEYLSDALMSLSTEPDLISVLSIDDISDQAKLIILIRRKSGSISQMLSDLRRESETEIKRDRQRAEL